MKVPLQQDLFLSISDLPEKEQLSIIKAIGYYPKEPRGGWPTSNTWAGIQRILDTRIEMRERLAERNRINGAKHTGRRYENPPPQETIIRTETQMDNSPFIALANDDSDLIEALNNPKSGLSIFLAIGQGYDDGLTRKEQQFADRSDVRSHCIWHRELQAATEAVKRNKVPDFVQGEWVPIVQKWLYHRKTKGKPYRSAMAVEEMVKELKKMSGDNANTASEIINSAIGKNYDGFFELKTTKPATSMKPKAITL